jgi:hypothetical protein
MFGGGSMGSRRLFVPLGGFPVCIALHGVSSYGSVLESLLYEHEADQLLGVGISARNGAGFPQSSRPMWRNMQRMRASPLTKFDHMT